MITVQENARKASKARWAKTTKKQRKEISKKLHEAKRKKHAKSNLRKIKIKKAL